MCCWRHMMLCWSCCGVYGAATVPRTEDTGATQYVLLVASSGKTFECRTARHANTEANTPNEESLPNCWDTTIKVLNQSGDPSSPSNYRPNLFDPHGRIHEFKNGEWQALTSDRLAEPRGASQGLRCVCLFRGHLQGRCGVHFRV